jgi:hypothetical protein
MDDEGGIFSCPPELLRISKTQMEESLFDALEKHHAERKTG